MKPASILAFALLSLAPLSHGQGNYLSRIGGSVTGARRVALGDVLYIGESYPKATGSITATGDLSIASAAKRVTIPWSKAPWDLRSKMQAERAAFESAQKPEESRLGSSEAALTARYGKPEPHPTPMPPAQKSLLYSPEGLRIVAHFVDGRAECLMVMKHEGSFSKEDAIRILSQCGRWTPNPDAPDIWRRSDGGFAIATGSALRIESGAFYKASRAQVKSAAESF
jgi:hypothetical protein